jgi:hypothetical protein
MKEVSLAYVNLRDIGLKKPVKKARVRRCECLEYEADGCEYSSNAERGTDEKL